MMQNSEEFIQELFNRNKFSKIAEDLSDDELYDFLTSKIKEINVKRSKLVALVGGVASGKTTLANKLVQRLGSADSITTDAFAAGTREYRHQQYGKVDKKYDLDLFNKKIEALKNLKEGENLRFPIYDEKTGIAAAAGEENFPKIVEKVEYFIIEGDFNFLEDPDLFIYLHVPDEVRTNNRIRRDKEKRGWTDEEKLREDIKVREEKQHFPFTLPNAEKADLLIEVSEDGGEYRYFVYQKVS